MDPGSILRRKAISREGFNPTVTARCRGDPSPVQVYLTCMRLAVEAPGDDPPGFLHRLRTVDPRKPASLPADIVGDMWLNLSCPE